MAGETPDYGGLSAQATVFPVTDLGELAARLGSSVTFDRRGDVLWVETFENGLEKWTATPQGTGAAVDLSSARARNGRYSARLVAGSDLTLSAALQHIEPYPNLSRLGLEFSFSLGSPIDHLDVLLDVDDGSNLTRFGIRWDDVNNVLQYFDSGGSWTTFRTGVVLRESATFFHTVKLVGDAVNNRYVRAILDDVESDLSGIDARTAVSIVSPAKVYGIELTGRAGQNDSLYVDGVIGTQNEPL